MHHFYSHTESNKGYHCTARLFLCEHFGFSADAPFLLLFLPGTRLGKEMGLLLMGSHSSAPHRWWAGCCRARKPMTGVQHYTSAAALSFSGLVKDYHQ